MQNSNIMGDDDDFYKRKFPKICVVSAQFMCYRVTQFVCVRDLHRIYVLQYLNICRFAKPCTLSISVLNVFSCIC
jgi:hypothetical protein